VCRSPTLSHTQWFDAAENTGRIDWDVLGVSTAGLSDVRDESAAGQSSQEGMEVGLALEAAEVDADTVRALVAGCTGACWQGSVPRVARCDLTGAGCFAVPTCVAGSETGGTASMGQRMSLCASTHRVEI
jgi:hypothetical protein